MATSKDFIVKTGLQVQGTATSTSITSGALVVGGGVGISGDLWVGGNIYLDGVGLDTVQGTTATFKNIYVTGTNISSSTSTGAVTIAGGLGVGGSIYGTALYDNGSRVVTAATAGNYNVSSITAGTDTAVSTSSGAIVIWNTSTLQTITNRGSVTTNAINITNATASAGVTSGALIVAGGAGISGTVNIGNGLVATTATYTGIVTHTSSIVSSTTATGAIVVTLGGGVGVGGQLTASKVAAVDGTAATTVGAGALLVTGGAYISNNAVIMGSASSTSTTASNALYVAGGLGVGNNLVVGGPAVFRDTVTFAGTATYVYSTNTYYTDNLIEIHTPPGGVGTAWTLDDNKDVGLRFHYYSGGDQNAALVLAGDTKVLEWYGSGAENASGVFTTATYGTFKTGSIILTSSTNTNGTSTGALTVAGGIGIGGNIFVGGTITRSGAITQANWAGTSGIALNLPAATYTDNSTLTGTSANSNAATWFGQPTFATTNTAVTYTTGATVYIDNAPLNGSNVTVTNPYALLVNNGTVKIGSATSSTSATSGALVVTGGVGISGNVNVLGIFDSLNTTDAALTLPGTTGSFQTNGGAGYAKNLAVGGTISRTGALSQAAWSGVTGVALNIPAATYTDTSQSASSTASGVSAANWLGQPTLAATNTAVTYTNAATLYIDNAPAQGTNVTLTNAYAALINNGVVRIASPIAATNTLTGALQIVGGVGIQGSLYGTALYDNGSRVLTAATLSASGVSSILAGTDTAVSSATGNVTIWNTATLQSVTGRGATTNVAVSITNTTAATSTLTGALIVAGGIGANAIYGSTVFDSGNRVVTTVTANAGTGIAISAATTSGAAASFTVTNVGVTSITGTANQIVANVSTGSVTLSFPTTGITSTTGTFTSQLFVTGTADSNSAITGALQVSGGVGIAKALFVGTTATIAGTLNVSGNVSAPGWLSKGIVISATTATYTDTSLTGVQANVSFTSFGVPTLNATNTPTYTDAASVFIAGAPVAGTGAVISNAWSLLVGAGNVKIAAATASITSSTGALVVVGGVGIQGNLNVGGTGSFSANGVTVGSSLISSYTSGVINTAVLQNLDTYAAATYRTARYMFQIFDTTGSKVHITEMTIFHDGSVVYKNEYGISTNTGELGAFDATLTGGTITITFTPNYTPGAMTIKGTRTAITA